jgi:hypothetical protein
MSDIGIAEAGTGKEIFHSSTTQILNGALGQGMFKTAASGAPPVIDGNVIHDAPTFGHESGLLHNVIPGALVVLAGVALFNLARNWRARRVNRNI